MTTPVTDVFESPATLEQWNDDYYHPISSRLYDRAIVDMLRLMGAPRGACIMDAGCGPGGHTIRAAQAGFRVCAVDISTTMLEYARKAVATAKLDKQVEFHKSDLTELDFPDASFRYVFSWGVIIHIPDATQALDELSRIIEPGGRLALYLTNKTAWDHTLEAAIRSLLRKPLIGWQRQQLGDGIWYDMNGGKLWVWRFDAQAVIQYLAAKGFRLINRRIGELSELQVRASGVPRQCLMHMNNLAYRLRVPPRFGCTSLYVFEKLA
jgi:ubiquinone/menaquinone biosynthesis C-methylase UbiE